MLRLDMIIMLETVIIPLLLLVVAPLVGLAVFRFMAKTKRVRRNVRAFRC
jgi:Tfp pilus assembly protein PilX